MKNIEEVNIVMPLRSLLGKFHLSNGRLRQVRVCACVCVCVCVFASEREVERMNERLWNVCRHKNMQIVCKENDFTFDIPLSSKIWVKMNKTGNEETVFKLCWLLQLDLTKLRIITNSFEFRLYITFFIFEMLVWQINWL